MCAAALPHVWSPNPWNHLPTYHLPDCERHTGLSNSISLPQTAPPAISTTNLIIRTQKAGSGFFLPVPRCHRHGPLHSAGRLLSSSCQFSSKGSFYLLFKTVEWLSTWPRKGWHIIQNPSSVYSAQHDLAPHCPSSPISHTPVSVQGHHRQPFYTASNPPYSFQAWVQGIWIIDSPPDFVFPHSAWCLPTYFITHLWYHCLLSISLHWNISSPETEATIHFIHWNPEQCLCHTVQQTAIE